MMGRLRSASIPLLVGCVITLLALSLIKSWLVRSQVMGTMQALDIGSWLRSQVPSFDAASWLMDLGNGLQGHKDELTSIGALATGAGVLIAAWALFINAKAQRLAAHTGSWNSSRDVLWKFNEQWEKKIYKSTMKALGILKAMPPYKHDPDIAMALNHFDSMAFFGNRNHFDDELAWTNYFDDAARLWNSSLGYIEWRRKTKKDWTLYCEYEPWIYRLADMNARRNEIAKLEAKPPREVATTSEHN